MPLGHQGSRTYSWNLTVQEVTAIQGRYKDWKEERAVALSHRQLLFGDQIQPSTRSEILQEVFDRTRVNGARAVRELRSSAGLTVSVADARKPPPDSKKKRERGPVESESEAEESEGGLVAEEAEGVQPETPDLPSYRDTPAAPRGILGRRLGGATVSTESRWGVQLLLPAAAHLHLKDQLALRS